MKEPKGVRIHFTDKQGNDSTGYVRGTPNFKELVDYDLGKSHIDDVQLFTEGFTSMQDADSDIIRTRGRTKSYMSYDMYKNLIAAEKKYDGGSTKKMFEMAYKAGNPLKVSYLYDDPKEEDVAYKDDVQLAVKVGGKKNEK